MYLVKEYYIMKNEYLNQNIQAYYSVDYLGYNVCGNPNYLNTLKNTFNSTEYKVLKVAQNETEYILNISLKSIIAKKNFEDCVILAVPRAKNFDTYHQNQLLFINAIHNTVNTLKNIYPNIIDGTHAIKRIIDTKTTHLKKEDAIYIDKNNTRKKNEGDLPYKGITQKTCLIDKGIIQQKNIILIDDIYTLNVNVDEDCLQAVLDYNPKELIFYSVARTKR